MDVRPDVVDLVKFEDGGRCTFVVRYMKDMAVAILICNQGLDGDLMGEASNVLLERPEGFVNWLNPDDIQAVLGIELPLLARIGANMDYAGAMS